MFYRRLIVLSFAVLGCSKAAPTAEAPEVSSEVTPLADDVTTTDVPDAVSPSVSPSADVTVS